MSNQEPITQTQLSRPSCYLAFFRRWCCKATYFKTPILISTNFTLISPKCFWRYFRWQRRTTYLDREYQALEMLFTTYCAPLNLLLWWSSCQHETSRHIASFYSPQPSLTIFNNWHVITRARRKSPDHSKIRKDSRAFCPVNDKRNLFSSLLKTQIA